jgi:pimeloyl-ACP methyl ester carboxylesterase
MWGGRRGGRGNHSEDKSHEDKSHEDKSHEDKMGLEVLARVGAPPVYVSSPESDAQCYLVEYRPPGGHGGPLHWLRRRLPLWRPPREERGRSPDKVGSRAICARGTTSALDWACDARVDQAPFTDCTGRALPGVRVHAGFYAQMVGLFGLVDAGVRRHLDRGRHLLCCGHSLGGAVAMLAALNYGSGYPGQVSYAGFGTPRVGNRAFAAEFDRCVRGGLRVRNRRDPVPCLIPEVSLPGLEYVHGGREVRLGTREEVEEVDEEYAWGLDDGGGQLLLDAQDHRIEAYVMRLRPVPGIYPVPGPPFKSA